MEFKFVLKHPEAVDWHYINRITVEFKCTVFASVTPPASILIESQWNLNVLWGTRAVERDKILIESQWNLNDDYIIDKDYHWKNINRITVEFKSFLTC